MRKKEGKSTEQLQAERDAQNKLLEKKQSSRVVQQGNEAKRMVREFSAWSCLSSLPSFLHSFRPSFWTIVYHPS